MERIIFEDTNKHKGQRNHLIDVLKSKGIKDSKVLEAIRSIPRHLFLPQDFENHAYEDKAFPIDEGQTISQPYTVAYQTQLLDIKKNEKVLEIGTGSGFQALLIQLLGAQLFSIERHQVLHLKAQKLIQKVCTQFQLKTEHKAQYICGDGSKGWIQEAPFDKIIVTAAAPAIPKALVNQLKTGGLLIIPVGGDLNLQKMIKITKTSDKDFKHEILDNFSFVPLLGENGWK